MWSTSRWFQLGLWLCLRFLSWCWMRSSVTLQARDARPRSLTDQWAIEFSWPPREGGAFVPSHLRIHVTLTSSLPRRLVSGSLVSSKKVRVWLAYFSLPGLCKDHWEVHPGARFILHIATDIWRTVFTLRNLVIKMCAELQCGAFAVQGGDGQAHPFCWEGRRHSRRRRGRAGSLAATSFLLSGRKPVRQ